MKAPGCYSGAFLLSIIVSTARAVSQKATDDQLEPPPPPPDITWSSAGMLRREKETDGPFERAWGEQVQAETKASIAKAFEYIDNKIGNQLGAGPTPLSQGPSVSQLQVAQDAVQLHKRNDTEKKKVPSWFYNGKVPNSTSDLKFEYQSAIGRDGYEPDPLRPASEFFGPFRIDYKHHTIFLENWNMAISTKLARGGMGNLIVGLNQSYDRARNSVILGDSNEASGSYGLVSGRYNHVNGRGAVISGGQNNLASGTFSMVAGGLRNNATGAFSSVNGGQNNLASGLYSVVNGGLSNQAGGQESTVNAGFHNRAYANISSINGGHLITIPKENVSETIEGGYGAGTFVVTRPPTIAIATAENTEDPAAELLAACSSSACGEEALKTEEKTAAARKHHAGQDHFAGGGEPEVRRRRSAPVVLNRMGAEKDPAGMTLDHVNFG